jgi:glutathione S-transferase
MIFRAHLNDLENIPAFLFISFLYICTNPNLILANALFWAYTIARYIHTLVYAYIVIPQPARGLSFGVGLLVTLFMSITVLIHFY